MGGGGETKTVSGQKGEEGTLFVTTITCISHSLHI